MLMDFAYQFCQNYKMRAIGWLNSRKASQEPKRPKLEINQPEVETQSGNGNTQDIFVRSMRQLSFHGLDVMQIEFQTNPTKKQTLNLTNGTANEPLSSWRSFHV
ncbi:hypothetical protein M514_08017 [Trichuris suis]|uniref:Uncharacterized protein n=1 Tax=Trichuris suis TaxID=68888 RepID=A0A085M1M1_9BILA|nr:hypothetical protein M513_08017 [Trichuris suis]KFD63085.1 hypothetical protein M514_08017 [Trichuris suis]